MSIPLVQNNEKDSINTSIIAIKRNIERINMLLGLSNSEEIDTSEFVKKSDIVDEVTVGNMHSVTSNAVAEVLSLKDTEVITGGVWSIDGGNSVIKKKVYRYNVASITTAGIALKSNFEINILNIISLRATIVSPTTKIITNAYCYIYDKTLYIYEQVYGSISNAVVYVFVEYI